MLEVERGTMVALSRTELTEALREPSAELRLRGVKAQLYVVGGAAMALDFDALRTTHDIDARIVDGHGAVMEAVCRIARKRGRPGS